MIYTVKDFSIVNEAEIYVILVFSYFFFSYFFFSSRTSLVAQLVKNLPAVQETWVWSLGWEDSLEKEMATHSSILAWKISWTQDPGGLQSMGLQRVRHDWVTNTYLLAFSMIQQMLAIWSLVPLPFWSPACISGISRFTYCWSLAWRILSITLLKCEMSAILMTFFWHCP